MEIEAKFAAPNASIARKLRAVSRIENYTFDQAQRVVVRDTFFDTRSDKLQNIRYVLRVRQRSDGKKFITLKTPAVQHGAIHHRPEIEAEIFLARTPRVLRVNELPAPIRKLVSPIVQDEPLAALFSISQTRDVRMIRDARGMIAEWSLDHVHYRAGKRHHAFYELEIELKKATRQNALQEIAHWLLENFPLSTEREGKFVRAVRFMREA